MSSRWAIVKVVYDGVVPMVAMGEIVGKGKKESEIVVVMMEMNVGMVIWDGDDDDMNVWGRLSEEGRYNLLIYYESKIAIKCKT